MIKLLAFLKRDFLLTISYKFPFIIQFIGIFFSMFIFYYVSKLMDTGSNSLLYKYAGNYFSFLIIGIAFSDFFLTSINSFSEEIRKGQLFGTLEALLSTPTSASEILIYSSFFNYLFSTLRLLIYLIFGWLFFNLSFSSVNLLPLFTIFLLSIFSFWGIGMLSATFVIIFKQSSPIKWLLGPATGLLGGVFYPVEILPTYLKYLALFLPVTHCVHAIRLILYKNANFHDIFLQLTALMIFSVILFPLGLYSFNIGLKIAKKNGSLLHY